MADILNNIAGQDRELLQFNCGLERETLRSTTDGKLSTSAHPKFLGSKLFNPRITTDFAESQLELITPVCEDSSKAISELYKTHRFIYSFLKEEILWPASMPCELPCDHDIMIASYGDSNLAQFKETYRRGLSHRYGRAMQTICAIHYNFSFKNGFWKILKDQERSNLKFQDYRTSRYFDLLRNFERLSWLPTYLFGASPAVSESFLKNTQKGLSRLDETTLYQPNATSLRNGSLGYKSATQSSLLNISCNSLEEYLHCLAKAICTKYKGYEELTSHNLNQLNSNILQSEAELYTSVRAKRTPRNQTNLLSSLQKDGVEYVEVRLLDIDPYEPIGISKETINFLDTFLLYCLMTPSPKHDKKVYDARDSNMESVVYEGRNSEVRLDDMGVKRSVREWGRIILGELEEIGDLLDQINGNHSYSSSIAKQMAKIEDPSSTPSARMLKDLEHQSFQQFAMKQGQSHRQFFLSEPLEKSVQQLFLDLVEVSIESQRREDALREKPFSDYLFKVQTEYQSIYQSMLGEM